MLRRLILVNNREYYNRLTRQKERGVMTQIELYKLLNHKLSTKDFQRVLREFQKLRDRIGELESKNKRP